MIQAICGACKHLFMAAVILGVVVKCPECGSEDVYAAVRKRNTAAK